MKKIFVFLPILLLILSTNSFAGFSKSYYSNASENIAVAVQIKEMGIYNLCVSATFVSRPTEESIYESDEYEKIIERLRVEWQDLAINKILEAGELETKDLIKLKKNIHLEINNLAGQLKQKLLPKKKVDVIFSISDFFLLEPKFN